MNLYDYQKSEAIILEPQEISAEEPTFTSLIMAAAWKADTPNYGKLRTAFPEIIEELEKMYFKGDSLQ